MLNLTPYTLKKTTDELKFDVIIDFNNPVFAGHFPGNPIFPGVYIIEMAKECVELHFAKKFIISHIKSCRFYYTITPARSANYVMRAQFSECDNGIVAKVDLSQDDAVAMAITMTVSEK